MVLAGRRSQWGLDGALDSILCLTDTSGGNLEPAYYWWHLTNMEQWLITKLAFDGGMLVGGKWGFSSKRLLLKWHKKVALGRKGWTASVLPNIYIYIYIYVCVCTEPADEWQRREHIDTSHMRTITAPLCLWALSHKKPLSVLISGVCVNMGQTYFCKILPR